MMVSLFAIRFEASTAAAQMKAIRFSQSKKNNQLQEKTYQVSKWAGRDFQIFVAGGLTKF